MGDGAAPGPPRRVRVLIVGAGFGGLGMAHTLRRMGLTDFVVLDRGDTVGGTWRDNTYPGCGCDVASHLYSFSFAPNPRWSRSYSLQPEILAYLERVAREHDLLRHVRLGTEVLGATWDDATARWRVDTNRGGYVADVLVAATGPLSAPQTPGLPGLDAFPGPVFHSATWRHDVDLTGRRVGVVGTGASAVQFVPRIQPQVGRLTLFQRTPPWILPRGDRGISAAEHGLYRRLPAAQKLVRAGHYTFREATVAGFVVQPAIMKAAELASRALLRAQVPDAATRRLLAPHYRLGCKRVLPSNAWYPALTATNTELVPHALAGVEGATAVAADGSRRDLDVLIFGTGFEVTDHPVAQLITGPAGRTLAAVWAERGRSALRCTTVAGFPNLFLILGPNSALGHSSLVYQVESQAAYIADAIAGLAANRLVAMEPRREVQSAYDGDLQRRMRHTVWQTGGCASYYQDARGRNTTTWPASTLRFRRDTRSVEWPEYHLRPLDPAVHAARETALTGAPG